MRDDLLLSGVYVWIMLQNVRMNQLVLSTKKHQGFVLEGARPAVRRSLIISRSFPDSFLTQTRFQRAPFIAPTKPRYLDTIPPPTLSSLTAFLSVSASSYSASVYWFSAFPSRAHTRRNPPLRPLSASTTKPATLLYSRFQDTPRASPVQVTPAAQAARTCASP